MLMGALVQVTTKVPSGAMATRDWFCTPGCCTPSNILVHLELIADGLAVGVELPREDVRRVGLGFEPGPAPDQVTTKLPLASMATSGLPHEVEAVLLTVNSGPIWMPEGL